MRSPPLSAPAVFDLGEAAAPFPLSAASANTGSVSTGTVMPSHRSLRSCAALLYNYLHCALLDWMVKKLNANAANLIFFFASFMKRCTGFATSSLLSTDKNVGVV